MAKDNWIKEQLAAGKTDSEILQLLVKKGWTESDARKALADSQRPPLEERFSGAEAAAFFAAVLGIILFFGYAFTFGKSTILPAGESLSALHQAWLCAAAIGFGLVLLVWALFVLAVRHHHPKLHKMTFLLSGNIVAGGFTCWLFLLVLLLLNRSGVVMTTFGLILIAGAMLALGVIVLELVYHHLRKKYDALPGKSAKRLVIVGLSLFVVYIVVLSAAAFWTENWLVGFMNQRSAESFAQIEEHSADARAAVELVDNAVLRGRFSSDLAEYDRLKAARVQRFSADEFFSDDGWASRCDAFLAAPKAAIYLSFDAQLAQDYMRFKMTPHEEKLDLEQYRSAVLAQSPYADRAALDPLPVRYKPYEDLAACFAEQLGGQDPNYRGLPTDPNLSDPAQRELVAFVNWHERNLKEAKRG